MLRHYLEVKAQHPDALLFYRMGDFYELFFDDARTAAPVLEVTLTARNKGRESEVPMCGVPHHALETYLGKALEAGFKVAICDQVEDPAEAKGLVRREVVRVVTPGTLSEPGLLDGKEDNLLASVSWDGEDGAGAFLDVSTGRFFVRRWASPQEGIDDLRVLAPREVLYRSEGRAPGSGAGSLPAELAAWIEPGGRLRYAPRRGAGPTPPRRRPPGRQLGVATLRGFGLEERGAGGAAAAAALTYARETQKSELDHVRELSVRGSEDRLVLDPTTLANLEVFRTLKDGGRKGTLLSVLDRTATAPGGRALRDWLRRPLREPAAIARRHRAVRALVEDTPLRERLRERLARVGDLERLLSRAVLGSLSPREAAALRDSLEELPGAVRGDRRLALGAPRRAGGGRPGGRRSPPSSPGCSPPSRGRAWPRAGSIAEGIDPELDRCRSLARDSKRHILVPGGGRSGRRPASARSRSATTRSSATTSRSPRRTPTWCRSGLHPQADPGQRRALRDAGDQGAGGADPLGRGAAARPRGGALRRLVAEVVRAGPELSRAWRPPSAPWTPWPPSPRWRPGGATSPRSWRRRAERS
jgi:DNA mismatch repair protein MutS